MTKAAYFDITTQKFNKKHGNEKEISIILMNEFM